MLEEDLEPLREPYREHETGQDHTYHLLERWGIPLDAAGALEDEILADLDPGVLGVRWWADAVPLRRRVLIGDYLAEAASALPRNVAEAKMHLSSYIACRRDAGERLRYHVVTGGYEVRRVGSPIEAVSSEMAEMHLAGLLRAMGSTFDCLAAAIIGVAGLPLPIKRAQWSAVVEHLRGDHDALIDIDALIDNSGPVGWDTWTLQMRNTWVHRPRRMTLTFFSPPWKPGPKVTVYLPRSPGLSEAEAFHCVSSFGQELLAEDAETTLQGAFDSTVELAQATTAALLDLWRIRRTGTTDIEQPARQWPGRWPPDAPASFGGYASDRPRPRVRRGEMVIAEKAGNRWAAAGVLDSQRHRFADAAED